MPVFAPVDFAFDSLALALDDAHEIGVEGFLTAVPIEDIIASVKRCE